MKARVTRTIRFRGQLYRLVAGQDVGRLPKELEKNLISAGLLETESALSERNQKVILLEGEKTPKEQMVEEDNERKED